jgi:catechol-2,3-dioxygenase
MSVNIKRTGHTAIEVEDIKRSADFYINNFGFEEGYIAEDWGIVRKNGDDIAFIKKGVSHHPPHFGLRVNSNKEVEEAFNNLKDKVKILKELKMHRDNSYSFYFADPDGNVVELIYDPNNP